MALMRGMAAVLARGQQHRLSHLAGRTAWHGSGAGALCARGHGEPPRAVGRRRCWCGSLGSLSSLSLSSSSSSRRLGSVASSASFSTSSAAWAAAPPPKNPPPPKEVAVLGGGLTGLTTAYYLAQFLPPTSRITLYEGSDRLGGWIDSEAVDVGQSTDKSTDNVFREYATTAGHTDDGRVVLEGGARMVATQTKLPRYDDLVLLELVDALDLVGELRVGNAELGQYICYPDHLVPVNRAGLSSVAGAVALLTEPLFQGALGAVARMLLKRLIPVPRQHVVEVVEGIYEGRNGGLPPDESVGGYFTRCSGGGGDVRPPVLDHVLSAIMHGVYGGDLDTISIASSPFRQLWINQSLRDAFHRYILWKEDTEMKLEPEKRQPQAFRKRPAIIDGNRIRENPDGTVFMVVSDYLLLSDITIRAIRRSKSLRNGHANRFIRLATASQDWKQMAFAGGFGTLTDRLADRLRAMPNVTIRTGQRVTKVRQAAAAGRPTPSPSSTATAQTSPRVEVVVAPPDTPAGGTRKATFKAYDRVVSTLTGRALYDLTKGEPDDGDGRGPYSRAALPSLRHHHAVTIQVVNLYYADHPQLNGAGCHGFGYLIPRTVPFEQNPESALGVLFDTDRELAMRPVRRYELDDRPADDDDVADAGDGTCQPVIDTIYDSTPGHHGRVVQSAGTKFTVMLGGHYWDGAAGDGLYPTPDEAVAMAERVVRRHLRDPATGASRIPAGLRPTATRTKLCRACIPQHYVGHARRLAMTNAELMAAFGGRLAVAGGSFTPTGPGVLPSLRSARDVALHVSGHGYLPEGAGLGSRSSAHASAREPEEAPMDFVGDTGLGRFGDPTTAKLVPIASDALPLRFGTQTLFDEEDESWMTALSTE